MNRRSRYTTWALVAIGLTGLALRLVYAWQPLDHLILWSLQDDAFYYYETAQRFALGQGITFDGLHAANGFHPLWFFFSAVAFTFVRGSAGVQAMLTLAAVLDTLTIFVLYRTVERLTGKRVLALGVAAFWAWNIRIVWMAMSGLETALSTLLIALLTYETIDALLARRVRPWRLGSLIGLTLLARTDGIVLVGVAAIVLASLGRRVWRRIALGLALGAAIVAPWLIWNLARFGTMMQVSGLAIPAAQWDMFYRQHPDATLLTLAGDVLTRTIGAIPTSLGLMFILRPNAIALGIGLIVAVALGVALVQHIRAASWWALGSRLRSNGRVIALLVLWPLAFWLAHAGFRRGFRFDYNAAITPAIFALIGLLIGVLFDPIRARLSRAFLVAVPVALAGLLVMSSIDLLGNEKLLWERGPLETASWIRAHLPVGEAIGSFNSGIIAFWLEQPVINLDGVINNSAYAAARAGRLGCYVVESGIRYLTDYFASDAPDAPFHLAEWATDWGYRPQLRAIYAKLYTPESYFGCCPWHVVYQVIPPATPPPECQ